MGASINYSEFFKALGDETRLRILFLLLNYPSLSVSLISRGLEIPQSKVSHHLAILRHHQWVTTSRRGKWVMYKIAPSIPDILKESLKQLLSEEIQYISDKNSMDGIIGTP